MKKYYLNVISFSRLMSFWISFIILGFITVSYLPSASIEFLNIAIIIFVFIASGYFAIKLSSGKIEITLTSDYFKHVWIKRFIFNREQNIIIKWNQIIDYAFEDDRGIDTFKMSLNNKMRYRILRLSYFPTKDDFKKFSIQFPTYINEINHIYESQEVPNSTITVGKSKYEQKSFKWVIVLMTLIFLVLLVSKIMKPESGSSWASLGIIGAGLIFYWSKIYRFIENN